MKYLQNVYDSTYLRKFLDINLIKIFQALETTLIKIFQVPETTLETKKKISNKGF